MSVNVVEMIGARNYLMTSFHDRKGLEVGSQLSVNLNSEGGEPGLVLGLNGVSEIPPWTVMGAMFIVLQMIIRLD